MDFCIMDGVEELEESKENFDGSFFSKNLVTFIDFSTFEEQFLTSYGYNNPEFRNFGVFTLQPRGNVDLFYSLNVNDVKLR